jgi:hypothetical protein
MKKRHILTGACLLAMLLGCSATAKAGFRFSFGFGIGFGGGHYRPYGYYPRYPIHRSVAYAHYPIYRSVAYRSYHYAPVRYTIVPRRTRLRRVWVPAKPNKKRNYSNYMPRRYSRRIP